MRIPRSFQLHGLTIKVVYKDDLLEIHDSVGMAHYRTSEIYLQSLSKQINRTKESQEQWFCHELVHFILQKMGKNKLQGDESFVDVFASLLHQSLTTAKYEEKIKVNAE